MIAKHKILLVIPITIILTIGFRLLFPSVDNSKTDEQYFWTLKTHTTERFDIVILGDSRIYRGVSPEILTENIPNCSAINLGYSSAGLSNLYFDFVYDKLNTASKNRVIILGISPHSLTLSALKNEELLTYLNQPVIETKKIIHLANLYKLTEMAMPSQLVNSLNVNKKKPINYHQEFYKNGWVKSCKDNPDKESALVSYASIFSNNMVSDLAITNLCERIQKWNKEGVKVICFRTPSSLKMEALEDSLSGFNEAEIKSKITLNGGLWIDYNSDDFTSYDGSHLHYKSAIILSKGLGIEVAKIMNN